MGAEEGRALTTQATAIRDAVLSRSLACLGILTFAPGSVRKIPSPTYSEEDVPMLSAFILSEQMVPDGDANAGEPSFVSTMTIGISIVRASGDPLALDGSMDDDINTIETGLFTDPTFVRFGEDCLFESITNVNRRRMHFGEGAAYFAELRLEIAFMRRVDFPPKVPDAFEVVHVTARPSGSSDATPPVIVEWDIPQE